MVNRRIWIVKDKDEVAWECELTRVEERDQNLMWDQNGDGKVSTSGEFLMNAEGLYRID
jgi:hypothetical protein